MYLKALEIQGFKSFPDKTVLVFGSDITAVVGPNGSGKSNISDAIRWVMGEQSTRTLRGSKMEDVIFNGTEKRKGLGFAEVTLVLDNTERIFQMEETEVAVTRRYYRSGESEYYINRRACRLRDINELFMDTGLGREGYSIIGQGRIDEILSVKSADRREVFEEAAGISRFRHRKEEAERKLERTEENLVRINDKISELELQVEPLRVQAEKTKKYQVFHEELKGLEISVWLDQLEKIRANSVKVQTDLNAAVRQRDEAREEQERLYAECDSLSEQMRDKDIQAEELRGKQSGMDEQVHSCENSIALLKNDIKNNSENVQRIRQELERQEGQAGSIAAQIEERKGRLGEIEGDMAACQKKLDALAESVREVLGSAGNLSKELERLQERERLETASAGEAKELLSALAAAAQELYDREEKLSQELQEQEDKASQAQEALDGTKKELDKVTEDRDAARNVISGYQMRLQSRQRKLDQVQEKHRRLQMDENNLNSRIKMLAEMEKMYEGYSKAVKLVMNEAERGGLRGIRGPVAGLIHVPDQYAVAIEIALGGAMQNLVVERDGERVVLKDFPMSRYKYEFEGNLYQGFGLIFGQVEDLSIPARIGQGFAQTLDFVRMVWMSLGDLVTGRVAVSELSGVIGVVDVVSEVGANSATAALGVQNVFYFMALIAVNLAVMNMLPIPALDGGRIFFVLLNGLIYAVARRRIPEKYEGYVHAGAFVVLLALMAVVALHDVWNIFA